MSTLMYLLLPVMVAVFVVPQPFQQDDPDPTEEVTITEEAVDPDDTDGDGVLNDNDLCDGFITGANGADDTGCPTDFDPYVDLDYDHDPHEKWYGRFWTGNCQGVPGFCLPGDPAWFTVSEDIAAQIDEDQQGVVRNRMWSIGRTVGFEWSSDPNLNDKQIFTGQLRAWGRQLERSDDILATVTEIENEVCELLGADVFEGGFTTAENCQPEPVTKDE